MDKSVQKYSKSVEYANKNRRITSIGQIMFEKCLSVLFHEGGGRDRLRLLGGDKFYFL